jgi:hypothetical protein
MSTLGSKADMGSAHAHVRFWLIANTSPFTLVVSSTPPPRLFICAVEQNVGETTSIAVNLWPHT